jgi:hypothetical protein
MVLSMLSEEERRNLYKISKISDVESELQLLIKKTEGNLNEIKEIDKNIDKIISEKSEGFPWISDVIAKYFESRALKLADYLENKNHPAFISAEKIREIAKEKREVEKKFRITYNLIKYYESLFPWLSEFVGENLDELIQQVTKKNEEEAIDDPVKFYLTSAEYEKLSIIERNQKALNRYWSKKKTPWELGRDYERYIGHLYEIEGFNVCYQGIEAGLEDLGRDLIARKDNQIKVIQCKYWAKHKTIHEKHICQLFGTTLKYWVELKKMKLSSDREFLKSLLKKDELQGIFITSTILSEVAKEFANELGIEIIESFPFKEYPSIKCNISKSNGEKIYHLPIDQQYDKTIIEEEKNECYVDSVAEAEKLGFRRAWRWKGNKE